MGILYKREKRQMLGWGVLMLLWMVPVGGAFKAGPAVGYVVLVLWVAATIAVSLWWYSLKHRRSRPSKATSAKAATAPPELAGPVEINFTFSPHDTVATAAAKVNAELIRLRGRSDFRMAREFAERAIAARDRGETAITLNQRDLP